MSDIATVELHMVGSRDNPNKAMLQLPAEVAGSPPLVVATESPLYFVGCIDGLQEIHGATAIHQEINDRVTHRPRPRITHDRDSTFIPLVLPLLYLFLYLLHILIQIFSIYL